MHHKRPLAAGTVIQRPPSVTVTLRQATIEAIDQFIRNAGAAKGIKSRSDAIQFFLDEAMPRCLETAAPDECAPSQSTGRHAHIWVVRHGH